MYETTLKSEVDTPSREVNGGLYLTTERFEMRPAFQCQKTRHPHTKMVMNAILTAMFTGVTLHL